MYDWLIQDYGWVWASYLFVIALILGIACGIIAELKDEVRDLQSKLSDLTEYPDEYINI